MKATGVIRKIDELGRLVIPKEIRTTMKIREGDPMEIFIDRDGVIILKKYSTVGEMASVAANYAESLSKVSGYAVIITDKYDIHCSGRLRHREAGRKGGQRGAGRGHSRQKRAGSSNLRTVLCTHLQGG